MWNRSSREMWLRIRSPGSRKFEARRKHWPIGVRSEILCLLKLKLPASTRITNSRYNFCSHTKYFLNSLVALYSLGFLSHRPEFQNRLQPKRKVPPIPPRQYQNNIKMLRRPPTAIGLTNEDVLKFEERRAARRELQATAGNQQHGKAVEGPRGPEKPKPRTVQDRIMGGG